MPPRRASNDSTSKSTVLVQKFEIRKSRKQENYGALSVNLGKGGRFAKIDAKIWQLDRFQAAGRPMPVQGKVIEATYRADEYKGMPQWTIEEYRILDGEEQTRALENFVSEPRIDAEYYRNRLEQLLGEADPRRVSAQILAEIFDRAEFRESFYQAPAAVMHHQNYRGGLLEHTINVTSLALVLADAYAAADKPVLTINSERLPVDRTLLISAGLLHDIGKLETYRLSPLSEATDQHVFEGHLSISYSIVRDVAQPLRESPPYPGAADEIDKLLNCILSHHGQLEFGSPVLPACIEALLLAQADIVDARLASILTEGNELLRQNPTARWLRHYHFPQGIFVGDWPKPPEV